MSTFRITGLRASAADLDQLRKAGLKVTVRGGPHVAPGSIPAPRSTVTLGLPKPPVEAAAAKTPCAP